MPALPPHLADVIKARFDYDAWRGRTTLDEDLFVWRLALSGREFPGWEAQRVERVERPGSPAWIHGLWSASEAPREVVVGMDIMECPSREAAHEVLVELLGDFQLPIPAEPIDADFGDVAFAWSDVAPVVFARGNLAVTVWNAGLEPVPLREHAARYDAGLVSRPTARRVAGAPVIRRFAGAAMEAEAPAAGVPLEVEASDPLGRALWYKFFTRSGEVRLERDRPVCRPTAGGATAITVYAVAVDGSTASRRVRLNQR
jgi:hypothetical protein